ncbi:MAG: peptidoglycan DD-metalloendopeptidase family protein, partial [Polyangiales bacterium]
MVPLVAVVYLRVDGRSLPRLRVAGEPLPRSAEPRALLAPRAQRWNTQQVQLVTPPHLTTATRTELGASLDADAMAKVVLSIGHSGDPLLDLVSLVRALSGAIDLPWAARIDRPRLGRYVRAVRNIVERPPVAGTVDQAGVTLAGVDGVTLDTVETAEVLERMLRSGQLRAEVALRSVVAPKIEIGTPDGIDDEHAPAAQSGDAEPSAIDTARMRAAAPRGWLPGQGCEPMDPPYERFCQGPRQVAAPYGEAAELAERLELGSLQTVGRLLNDDPRSDWVTAAGPRAPGDPSGLLWPVPAGRLWRRFGFIRKPPFEHLLHRGIDVGAPRGTPLYAVNPGIVAYADNKVRGYGNLLVVVHADGGVSFSAHCRAIYVFAGQRVLRGQIVGEVGDTG